MTPHKMKTKVEISYCWKLLSKEGHLLDPQTSWGEYVFNTYGYPTREEAFADYQNQRLLGQTLVLIETYTTVADWDNND